jgi:hypothetical protein
MGKHCCDVRLPIGAALLQAAFIVLFGVFVRYDETLGMPKTTTSHEVSSNATESVSEHLNTFYASRFDLPKKSANTNIV